MIQKIRQVSKEIYDCSFLLNPTNFYTSLDPSVNIDNLYEKLNEVHTFMNKFIECDDNIPILPYVDRVVKNKCQPSVNHSDNNTVKHIQCSDLPLRKKRKSKNEKDDLTKKCKSNNETLENEELQEEFPDLQIQMDLP